MAGKNFSRCFDCWRIYKIYDIFLIGTLQFLFLLWFSLSIFWLFLSIENLSSWLGCLSREWLINPPSWLDHVVESDAKKWEKNQNKWKILPFFLWKIFERTSIIFLSHNRVASLCIVVARSVKKHPVRSKLGWWHQVWTFVMLVITDPMQSGWLWVRLMWKSRFVTFLHM